MKDLYSPCFCGSGKKFKFCCKNTLTAKSIDENILENLVKLPLAGVYIHPEWEEIGITPIVIVRGFSNYYFMANYLVDIWCLGLKDTFFKWETSDSELRSIIREGGMIEYDYELAKGLILGSIEFAKIIISPHKDWEVTKYLIEYNQEYKIPKDFSFGNEGKHYYVAGNSDEELFDVDKVINNVEKAKGEFIVPVSFN